MKAVNEQIPAVNVCLNGHGVVCGLQVHVNPDCSINVSAGSAVARDGTFVSLADRYFSYYKRQPSAFVQKYFPHDFSEKHRTNRSVLELAEGAYNGSKMDSLKQQYPNDLPTRNLLENKILVVLIDKADTGNPYFLLVSQGELIAGETPARIAQLKALSKEEITENRRGFFNRDKGKEILFSDEVIEQAYYPYLQLPEVLVPRFGYKTLAISDPLLPFGAGNFVNPFSKIGTFRHIFDEYKAILDDLVPEFEAALEKLHKLYGARLTHKGADYWDDYRKILIRKWQVFLEEGEHFYYIQYFYDWLTDLVKAYEELKEHLAAFSGACYCGPEPDQEDVLLVRLGPVLGGGSSYLPLLFRDYFQQPMINGDNAGDWNEIRFLHWRIMMMIWTFDLPQLKLNLKVLVRNGYLVPAKEFEDSTDYFEKTNANRDEIVNLEDVPVKLTPGQTRDKPLGDQAIPYYYPLDNDSPYSLHQYWNYRLTQTRRTRHIRSFNAIEDGDSYTRLKRGKYHVDSQYPLAFGLRDYPYLKAEGHVGKKRVARDNSTLNFWKTLIWSGNLTVNVVLKPVSELAGLVGKTANDSTLIGPEHTGGVEQGDTLVLVYVENEEQIDLSECRQDNAPEIEKNTIVADFTLPFLLK